MNSSEKNAPLFRFPEFKGDSSYTQCKLGDIASIIKGRGISKAEIVENGRRPCIRYGELYTHYSEKIVDTISFTNSEEDHLVFSKPNDVLIPSSGETREDIARASCVTKGGIAIGGDINIIRTELDGRYLAYYLSHEKKHQISQLAQGDAVVHLYATQLSTLNISYPTSADEQQKIADCLSSLDELIAAEMERLEALRAHKKGLMQVLFPAEGERVPKVRFKGFGGEWESTTLGSISENLDQKRIPLTENTRVKGCFPYYGASGIIDYVADYIFDEDLLCVSEDGANLVTRTYPIAFSITGKTWVNNHAHVLRFENPETRIFVENFLNHISLEDYLTGMAQPKLNKAQLDSIAISVPQLNEQQKIAACLSSVDGLIAEQEARLEGLRAHKRGLMQGMFAVAVN